MGMSHAGTPRSLRDSLREEAAAASAGFWGEGHCRQTLTSDRAGGERGQLSAPRPGSCRADLDRYTGDYI